MRYGEVGIENATAELGALGAGDGEEWAARWPFVRLRLSGFIRVVDAVALDLEHHLVAARAGGEALGKGDGQVGCGLAGVAGTNVQAAS